MSKHSPNRLSSGDDGGGSSHRPHSLGVIRVRPRLDCNRQEGPVDEVGADCVAPGNVPPLGGLWVVLIKLMIQPIVVHRPYVGGNNTGHQLCTLFF
jgi:hypothetical protein